MNRKYFFFDIDGTLTDRATHKIVPSAQVALDKLQENGHFVAIATGRAYYKCADIIEQTKLKNFVCYGGGGLVLDNKLIKCTPLPLEDAKALLRAADKYKIGYLVMIDDSIKVYCKNNLFREQIGDRKESTEYHIDPDFDYEKVSEIYKIYLALPKNQEDIFPLTNLIGHLRFQPEYLIYQYDAKDQGIYEMMKYLNADVKDVVVFGDDTNDMVMFKPEWTSIAMGNACDELKQMATYVTDKNVDDGVYNACRKFGWI